MTLSRSTICWLAFVLLAACQPSRPAIPAATDTSTPAQFPQARAPTDTPAPQQLKRPTETSSPSATVTPSPSPATTSTTTAAAQPSQLPVTELHLHLKSPQGDPVSIIKAELFMAAWGSYGFLPLSVEQDLLVLPLEESAIQSDWLDEVYRIGESAEYMLYLEAEGYAPVQSMLFRMFKRPRRDRNDTTTEAVITFPSGAIARVTRGTVAALDLQLRELEERRLYFVDDSLAPLPGVRVKAFIFWSKANHCGIPQLSPLLAEAVSDSQGRAILPDGDFMYWLALSKPFYHLMDFTIPPPPDQCGAVQPLSLVTYLSDKETTVVLHRLRKQPLEMLVQRQGQPLADQDLCGQGIGTVCNFYDVCFPIATTDENGRISLEDFYPEEWDAIFFMGETGLPWIEDPNDLPLTEVIHVELP